MTILILTFCAAGICREQEIPVDATMAQCQASGWAVMATAHQHAQPGERLAYWRCEVGV